MKKLVKKILIVFGVGITCLAYIDLSRKNARLEEENRILKENLSDCNNMLDKKNMTIGKLVTEMKVKYKNR